MKNKKISIKEIEKVDDSTYHYWYVLILKPVVHRIIYLVVNFTKLSPNQLTIIGFFLGAISSILFFKCNSSYKYLMLGAIFHEISYIFDCIDGRVARITHMETGIGRLLDSSLDQLRTFLILIGLTLGRYHTTGDYRIFLLGLTYAFLYPNFWLIQWRIESINNEYYNCNND